MSDHDARVVRDEWLRLMGCRGWRFDVLTRRPPEALWAELENLWAAERMTKPEAGP